MGPDMLRDNRDIWKEWEVWREKDEWAGSIAKADRRTISCHLGSTAERATKRNDASLGVNAKMVFESQKYLGWDPGSAPSARGRAGKGT